MAAPGLLMEYNIVTVANCVRHIIVVTDFVCFFLTLVLMIIKGLFRRHERWNPVHPTYGAFWGMGVGVGCGVGWGPGFGPEVIGYVGAGCGIGFNVGITFAGIGIGLPANFVFEASYNGVSWIRNLPCISDLQREANEKWFRFSQKHLLIKGIDFLDMKNSLPLITSSASRSIQAFHNQLFCSDKGILFWKVNTFTFLS
ncbi:hypothetical protein VNO78_27147 [Psophocarpus tetragonolobus]|uniref:Cadmium-induced protein AS8 n=1 Tax=Psophocarpus tetragonolobus TaxID=3891 RepID=A0AAN9S0R3_PSOTE